MADNTELNLGSGGDTIATDDIGGVKHQQVKVEFGTDGTATPVSSGNPLPVSIASAVTINDPVDVATTNLISTVNSRAPATLAAGAVFQGTVENVANYGRAGISIKSDNATDGVLTMETSHDGVAWGGPTRNFANTSIAEPHMWEIVEKYFRIKYTNGTTEATNLSIQTQYSNNGGILLGHQLDATLIDETEAIVTRSVAVAKNDEDTYVNVGAVTKAGRTSLFTVSGYANTFSIHFDHEVTPGGNDFAYMLVDLSNTAVWPHTNTGEIVLEYIIIEIDPSSSFTGDFKIGYLKNVDATNGDFVTVIDVDMARRSDIFHEQINFNSHSVHCSDTNHFGPTLPNSTLFQTDVNLGGPDDPSTLTYPSGDGDLVLIVSGNNNAVGVSITLGYETSV